RHPRAAHRVDAVHLGIDAGCVGRRNVDPATGKLLLPLRVAQWPGRMRNLPPSALPLNALRDRVKPPENHRANVADALVLTVVGVEHLSGDTTPIGHLEALLA